MSVKKALSIDIEKVIASKNNSLSKRIPKFILRYLKKIIHQDEINDILEKYGDTEGVDFAENILKYLNVRYRIHNQTNLNPDGRYVFVSNHPLGGFDGLILISYIGKKYPEIKFIVNDLLMNIEPLESIFIPVNKYGLQGQNYAVRINEAYNSNAQILYFPAGLCSRLIKGKITDPEWKKNFLKKAIETKRDIVPIFFDGKNSMFFYRLAKIRKLSGIKFNIETLYLADEMFKQKNNTFDIYFGDPIPIATFTKEKTLTEWTLYIREKVYGAYNKSGRQKVDSF